MVKALFVSGLLVASTGLSNAFLPVTGPRYGCRVALRMSESAGEVLPTVQPGVEVRRLTEIDGETKVAKYGVKGTVTAAEYRKVYSEALAEHKKQASFPGFRAGRIPPHLMNTVREFSVVAAIETAALAGLEQYELEATVPPSGVPEIKVNLPEEVGKYSRAYTGKEDIVFDAELEAKGEPRVPGAEKDDEVVDVTAGIDGDEVVDVEAKEENKEVSV